MKHYKHYLVGGAVRDQLMGLPCKDWDYAVEAPSYEAMEQWVIDQGGTIFDVPGAKANLTIRARVGKKAADYVLCRRDGEYSDGRRPDSVSIGNIYDDLARRDFTVNAMAIDQDTGELLDPHNGKADLDANRLKCVGSAIVRFQEDHLRILRAARFHITKGFVFDNEIDWLLNMHDICSKLTLLPRHRIYDELKKCFAHDTWKTLEFFEHYKYLSQFIFINCKMGLEVKGPNDEKSYPTAQTEP